MTTALLSIHSKYAAAIYAGIKTVELRSVPPKKPCERMYLYETAPKKLITGFIVPGVIGPKMDARELTDLYGIQSLLGPSTLSGEEAYIRVGQIIGFTKKYHPIEIVEVVKLENPIKLSGRPPQNFYYL
jgi:predicted transcriptional regulator